MSTHPHVLITPTTKGAKFKTAGEIDNTELEQLLGYVVCADAIVQVASVGDVIMLHVVG